MVKPTSSLANHFSKELWYEILSYLSVEQCLILRATSRFYRTLVEGDLRWTSYFNSNKPFQECIDTLGEVKRIPQIFPTNTLISYLSGIITLVKKDFSRLPVILSQLSTYHFLVKQSPLLTFNRVNHGIVTTVLGDIDTNAIVLENICAKFLQRMKQYYPVDIVPLNRDEILEMLEEMRNIDHLIDDYQKGEKLIAMIKKNRSSLPLLLLTDHCRKILYNYFNLLNNTDDDNGRYIKQTIAFFLLETYEGILGLDIPLAPEIDDLSSILSKQHLSDSLAKHINLRNTAAARHLIVLGACLNHQQLDNVIANLKIEFNYPLNVDYKEYIEEEAIALRELKDLSALFYAEHITDTEDDSIPSLDTLLLF